MNSIATDAVQKVSKSLLHHKLCQSLKTLTNSINLIINRF